MTLATLLTKWLGKEKAGERAEYQQFLTELMQALNVATPGDGGVPAENFRFEAPVKSAAIYGGTGTKRIDLYKRGHFILEAKQSQLRPGEAPPPEPAAAPAETVYDLFGTPIGTAAPQSIRPKRRYDRLMEDARIQAQRYALALPDDHATPPFLIVADIGHAFELYFDFAGNGRGYRPFPDERGYRIALADLTSDAMIDGVEATAADTLRAIWTDPASIDPRTRAAKVTRDIAERLSRVAAQLERDQRDLRPGDAEIGLGIEATSLFLMRTLFCMFAEDVGLLKKNSFKDFLTHAELRTDMYWRTGLEGLWSRMNDPLEANRFWSEGDAVVRYFNGNLFSGARVYDLPGESKRELRIAADQDWRAVEPAIFGTLLEQVLTTADRAKLGAHYTPRPYVDRLVQATVMDVLTPEWEGVRDAARAALNPPPAGEGDRPKGGGGERPVELAPQVRGSSGGRSDRTLAQTADLRTADSRADRASAPASPPRPSTAARSPSPASAGEDYAIRLATDFHARLVAIRILDPACGTGNFLYVAMEALLRLESEVRQFVIALGGTLAPAIHPNQFLGLELNPRAAVIAELVLWIGWLRYRLANTPEAIGEPVLPPLHNINGGKHGGYDAVLVRTASGEPDTADPRRPEWPEADFIVGNPPFIGGKDIRDRLGSDYAEALWRANPRVPKSADYVMHWWDRAADILTRPGTRLRRFGFVTTNSITQVFSRRVIEGRLSPPSPSGEGLKGKLHQSSPTGGGGGEADGGAAAQTAEDAAAADHAPASPARPSTASRSPSPASAGEELGKLHLVLAIPDHPWTRVTKDAAAVRIAMTVAAAGSGDGRLIEIVREARLDRDDPDLDQVATDGRINADLSVGTDVTDVIRLMANAGICHDGVKLHGKGFSITRAQATDLGLGAREGLDAFIRPYRNGRDLTGRTAAEVRDKFVIDLFGLGEAEVMNRFPEVYQHLLRTVRPERNLNVVRVTSTTGGCSENPGVILRPAVAGIDHYLATVDTSKHRIFQILPADTICDDKVVLVASDELFHLGVLSSMIHLCWASAAGGLLEDRPVYVKSQIFDPFPFPDRSDAVAAIAERLDTTRRAALAEDPALTMTGLYNLVAAIRDGTLSPDQERAASKARAHIVAKLHDGLDCAVADAYGWGDDWRRAPLPPAEIVRRLVALNATRAAEEATGHIRWLRPDYQRPRFERAVTAT